MNHFVDDSVIEKSSDSERHLEVSLHGNIYMHEKFSINFRHRMSRCKSDIKTKKSFMKLFLSRYVLIIFKLVFRLY